MGKWAAEAHSELPSVQTGLDPANPKFAEHRHPRFRGLQGRFWTWPMLRAAILAGGALRVAPQGRQGHIDLLRELRVGRNCPKMTALW